MPKHQASRDGVYCDASMNSKRVGIAIVLVRDGAILEAHVRVNPWHKQIHMAEMSAIAWAKSLYPDEQIYSDNSSAAKKAGAIWISRNENKAADRLASAIIDPLIQCIHRSPPGEIPAPPVVDEQPAAAEMTPVQRIAVEGYVPPSRVSAKKRKAKKTGRGVLSAGEPKKFFGQFNAKKKRMAEDGW